MGQSRRCENAGSIRPEPSCVRLVISANSSPPNQTTVRSWGSRRSKAIARLECVARSRGTAREPIAVGLVHRDWPADLPRHIVTAGPTRVLGSQVGGLFARVDRAMVWQLFGAAFAFAGCRAGVWQRVTMDAATIVAARLRRIKPSFSTDRSTAVRRRRRLVPIAARQPRLDKAVLCQSVGESDTV